MRRYFTVGGLIVAWLGVTALLAVTAGADDDELEDYLRKASEAEFSGREVIVSYWGDESTAGLYDVTQASGMTMVGDGVDEVMLGSGRVETRDAEGYRRRNVADWSGWRLHERYTLGAIEKGAKFGRSADIVPILEAGSVRMRVVFDSQTGAALQSEVFDGDGELYRMALVLDFSTESEPMMSSESSDDDYEVDSTAADADLPESAGGYWRADTYGGPGSTVHAFYTDGLFAFSVFQIEGRARPGEFEHAEKWKAGGEKYRRFTDPGAVRLFWQAPDATYVLVGDLPPDHLTAVVADLPEPGRPNVFVRMWRRLFG